MSKEDKICSACGGVMRYEKSWKIGAKGSTPVTINLFRCQKCGATTRTTTRE